MGPLPAWCCASLEVFSWNWLLLQMWEFDPPSKKVVSDSFAGGGEALGVLASSRTGTTSFARYRGNISLVTNCQSS